MFLLFSYGFKKESVYIYIKDKNNSDSENKLLGKYFIKIFFLVKWCNYIILG